MSAPIHRLNISKYGTKNYGAILAVLSHSDLGISRSYYNKLKRRGYPSANVISRIEHIVNRYDRYPIELYDNTPVNIKVPQYLIKRYKRREVKGPDGKPDLYTKVTFKLGSRGNVYYQGFVILNTEFKGINQRLKDYIDFEVKKYDDHPVYIYAITFQNV